MTLPIILGAIALKLVADTVLDYLYPDSVADGTLPTTALSSSAPYTPPFLGGQCVGVNYRISYKVRSYDGTYAYQQLTVQGAISIDLGTGEVRSNGVVILARMTNFFDGNNPKNLWQGKVSSESLILLSVVRLDGQVDGCGNVPDPNYVPPPSIPSGGIPQNLTPAITPTDTVVEGGLPVLFTPSILSALAGLAAQIGSAIAAAQAASDSLAAAKAIADAVGKLADMIDAQKDTLESLRKYLNKKEKEDAAKKRYLIRQYGTILKDGYLDLTPRPAPDGFKPLMLDFLCANVPNGLGRMFGINSYNWFRYQELGHICFLSPTSGVLSVHKIEHVRTSIPIPELAIGFTYNMGLNGVVRARVSMLYTQEKS